MPLSTPASYKKKAGTLSEVDGGKSIQWVATGSDKPAVTIPTLSVAGMVNTPPTSANNIIKITVTQNGEESKYSFSFASRDVMNTTISSIKELTQAQRQAEANAKAEQAKAEAAAAQAKEKEFTSLDSKSLLSNHALQQRLLKENKELMSTFQQAVMQGGLSSQEFWSTRIVLLRSFAFSSQQKRGRYNVLSTIKPKAGDDNKLNVSLSREKIHDIFEQYPIVREAYNDNVPTIPEGEFWAKFFTSKLYRKLKGEKINPNDAIDTVLDKYLVLNEEAGQKRKAEEENYYVPQYLDVEGNVENSPDTFGNRPDITMIAGKSGRDTMSLIRSMNHLSQRMLQVDQNRLDYANEESISSLDDQMKLSDLGGDDSTVKPVELSVKDSQLDVASEQAQNSFSHNDLVAAQMDMKSTLQGEIDLSSVTQNTEEIGASRNQVNETIRLRSMETSQNLDTSEKWGGDKKLLDQIQSCHATSIEFLRHFWIHFQSGDPNQAAPLAKLIPSLKKSKERVEAVIQQGSTQSDQEKVRKSLLPLVSSIDVALQKYDRALATST